MGKRVVSDFLYRVDPHDSLIYGAVVVMLEAATLLACLVPALRASRVDPIVVLRQE
jgi:ABC-type lipoprotein release transport system permease subunit